ncbi:hypothetical protein RCH33_500 [Flavobacterium daejeonense]|nr:hypothetical protein RCH33_500 [Flavobacterium daejeonense]
MTKKCEMNSHLGVTFSQISSKFLTFAPRLRKGYNEYKIY